MINLFKMVEEVDAKCTSLMEDNDIFDYRIILNYNNLIDAYVILGQASSDTIAKEFSSFSEVNLNS